MRAFRDFVTEYGAAIVREWQAIRADKAVALVVGVASLLYAVAYPIPYLRQLARDIPVVIVDQDGSVMSRLLARMVNATEQVEVARVVGSFAEAEALVREGKMRGAVVIPAEFERSVQRGDRAVIGVYGDASYFMVYSQIATGVSQAVGTLSAGVELRRLQAGGLNDVAARRARDPLPVSVRPLYNPSGGYGNTNVPVVLVLVLQQTMLIGIATLAGTRRERRGSAVNAEEPVGEYALPVLLGRASAYVGIYLVHAVAAYAIAYGIYDLPHYPGTLPRLLVFLLPFLFAAAFLGLTISRLFLSRESALQALIFTSVPAIFISGFSFPAEAMPAWLRALAQLLPSTHGIAGALRVVQMGASLTEVRGPWLTLWVLSAVYLALASFALRRRVVVDEAFTDAGATPAIAR
jgi:ABC-2 type transport system permease protein